MSEQIIPALYVIGTPIGNLQDITLRALTILRGLGVLYAEDTRVTRVLLERHGISVPLQSYREAAPRPQVERTILDVIKHIEQGEAVGYVSDAGTPGISDPGDYLVRRVKEAGHRVIPIPGPSALAALLSVAGFGVQRPLFVGFLPRKKGKETLLRTLHDALAVGICDGFVVYESPERLINLLTILEKWDLNIRVCVGRELTKKFEEITSGPIQDVRLNLESNTVRGEVSILVAVEP